MKKQSLLNAYRESQSALRNLANIANAPDGDTAWSFLEKLCRDLGFDYSGVGVIGNSADELSIGLTHATAFFSTSFEKYHAKNLHLNDPTAHRIAQGDPFMNAEDVLNAPPCPDGALCSTNQRPL